MKIVTAEEMRQLEAAAVAGGTSEAQLMEEAGLAAAQEAWMLLGTIEERRVLVLAGPGKNGGDGLVVARHVNDWGADVTVYAPLGRAEDENLSQLRERGVTLLDGTDAADAAAYEGLVTTTEFVIDALLGTGRSRPIEDGSPIALALDGLKAAKEGFLPPRVLAVDLPTGVDADSGSVDPHTVPALTTVTFGLPKRGMYLSAGADMVGDVQVVDIGLPKDAVAAISTEVMTSRWAREHGPVRPESGNKGTFGSVIVIGGSARYRGAPVLAANGAYRAGAGLVTIACPEGIVDSIVPGMPEATWLPQPETEGCIADAAVASLRPELAAYNVAVLGPGMGQTVETRALTWGLLDELALDMDRGLVIDADGLNALATMEDAAERMPGKAVLTPHPGEMARLLKTTVEDVQARRIDCAQEVAERFGCVVVLKGSRTVVASPGGDVRVSPFGNPLLASAGTGDVLAGMIGGYLAQGMEPFEAASYGVYLHAAAGEKLREEYGDGGLLAREVANALPGVARELSSG